MRTKGRLTALFAVCLLISSAGALAWAQTMGQTMLANVEKLREDALPEQALMQLDPVIQLLEKEVQSGESPPQVLAQAHLLKANLLLDLGRPQDQIKAELDQAFQIDPNYRPQKYLSHPDIQALLGGPAPAPAPAPAPSAGKDYTAEYNMAVNLYNAKQYCAVLTILTPIADQTPDPKAAHKLLEESRKLCQQAPAAASCPPTPPESTVLVLPVIYKDDNQASSSLSLAGALDHAALARSLSQVVSGISFCPLSQQKADDYRREFDQDFKAVYMIKDWSSLVLKKLQVTVAGLEKLPECAGAILQEVGRREGARYFLLLKVKSPRVNANSLFLKAEMDLNIYDLQVEGGRKLVGKEYWLNLTSKDDLQGKAGEVVSYVRSFFGR
ncbi:MAG: hypothetical protein AB1896_02650 [Thermodesulfobacteriota bacterium]